MERFLRTLLELSLAGSLLAGTVHAERVEHLVTPCKNLFGAVFFVSVGFMVQPAMIVQYIWPILLLSVVAIVGKLVSLTLGGLAAGQGLETSLRAGAAQTQVGEFSFIIAGLGQSLSVTGAFLYPIIVAVSVVTTFTTPLALKFATPLCRWLERVLPERWVEGMEHYAQARQRKKPGQTRIGPSSCATMAEPLAFLGCCLWGPSSWGCAPCGPSWRRSGWMAPFRRRR